MLNDGIHKAMVLGKDPAIAAGVAEACGEKGHCGLALSMAFHKLFKRFRAQKWHIAIEDEKLALEPF
jgi:hypothetical protein